MPALHPLIEADLRKLHEKLSSDGSLPSASKLQTYYDAFRREFGPEVLRSLDGQTLLERMHAHGNRTSMVYWLEFKDDEEFPAMFGSISGGSALKFGIFRRAENGAWATKGPSPAPREISLNEAIEIARRHRDQLLAAVDVMAGMRAGTDDHTYLRVQDELRAVAPDIEDTAWGHKYLSLLFPDKLDDFHVESFQRYHLGRMLQVPPKQGDGYATGRYVCAGRFAELSRYLGLSIHELTTLLNRRDGSPKTYWRIGTTDDQDARQKYWPLMRDGDLIAVGWQKIGDLSSHSQSQESKDAIVALVRKHYPKTASQESRGGGELFNFVTKMAVGDRVAVADGQKVLGIAEVAGSYSYDSSAGFHHQRPVSWRSLSEWTLTEGLRSSVRKLKDPENIVSIETRILEDGAEVGRLQRPRVVAEPSPPRPIGRGVRGPLKRLNGVSGQLQAVLERKGQAILYGPPGTGKTHWALRTARELASYRAFGLASDELDDAQRMRIIGKAGGAQPALVRVVSFHPEYGYEDFIEGYRPATSANGSLTFTLERGVFRRLCDDAARSPELDFYLVIDEINRGDVPRIFGELLTLLESDKRGETLRLSASGEAFHVPSNVFLIGTMNTADRSIALLDVALRRRFGFVELMPDYSLLEGAVVSGLPLDSWLRHINGRIRAIGGSDARNRQIGHAFLLVGGTPLTTMEQLSAVLRDDVIPLIEEYCYDDFEQVAEIIGPKLVDKPGQRVRRELLEPDRGPDLISALNLPEIATRVRAVLPQDEAEDDDTEAGDDAGLTNA